MGGSNNYYNHQYVFEIATTQVFSFVKACIESENQPPIPIDQPIPDQPGKGLIRSLSQASCKAINHQTEAIGRGFYCCDGK